MIIIFSLLIVHNKISYASEYIISYPYLGVQCQFENRRAVVVNVIQDTNIYRAGLQKGDIIKLLNRKSIISPGDLERVISSLVPGQKANLFIQRNEKNINIDFVVQEKKIAAYYNDNLKKMDSYVTGSSLINSSSPGFSKSVDIWNNYLMWHDKVMAGSIDSKDAAIETISSLYELHDRAKNSNDKLNTDIYAYVNYRLYEMTRNNIIRFSKKNDLSKEENNLSEYFNYIFSNYFLPNYSSMPDFNELLTVVNNNHEKEKSIMSSISKKYSATKGGWKFLKWGMTLDETNILLKYNQMDKLYLSESEYETIYYDIDIYKNVKSDMIKEASSSVGNSFYYFNDKLIAVKIGLGEHIRVKFDIVVNELKKKFPKGKIYGKLDDVNFKYVSNDLIVVTFFHFGSCSVYYVDPRAVKEIQNQNKIKKEGESEEEKDNIKSKF